MKILDIIFVFVIIMLITLLLSLLHGCTTPEKTKYTCIHETTDVNGIKQRSIAFCYKF